MRSIAKMAQLTPEARTRLDTFKAVTVKHTHLSEVDEQLSLWVEEHTDATHVLLCGPGGVETAKALSVVAERFQREELDRFVVPILLLEPIPPDLGPYLRLDYYWLLDDYCFCRCCQLLNSKKGCFFALSMAHVFQTILSVDVKEKAIAALISTLKMVHSAPLLIIDATGTSNRLPSVFRMTSEELE